MVRVKVTGFIEVEGDEADANHETGLSTKGFDTYSQEFMALDDLDFVKVESLDDEED